jgi:hypothetical protein
MARRYNRDSKGRFASGGGGSARRRLGAEKRHRTIRPRQHKKDRAFKTKKGTTLIRGKRGDVRTPGGLTLRVDRYHPSRFRGGN